MIRRQLLPAVLVLLVSPELARAQEDAPPAADAPAAEASEAAKPEEKKAEAETAAPASDDRPFPVKRGFYAEADLGVYFTLGGYNTGDPSIPKKGLSNVQPYLGVVFGYDLLHSESFAFSTGLKLAAGYSGGASRVSGAESSSLPVTDLQTKAQDFAVHELGLALALAIQVSDRVAVTVKADAGLAAVDPSPALVASEPGAASAAFAPIFGGGLGVEYFTLLNDFSVGLDARFAMVAVTGAAIPGLSLSVPIKYTF